jgi:hypothetical protein
MENKTMETSTEGKAKIKAKNPWLEFVKEVSNEHKDLSYKEVLKLAAESYNKVEKKMKKPQVRKLKEATSQKINE